MSRNAKKSPPYLSCLITTTTSTSSTGALERLLLLGRQLEALQEVAHELLPQLQPLLVLEQALRLGEQLPRLLLRGRDRLADLVAGLGQRRDLRGDGGELRLRWREGVDELLVDVEVLGLEEAAQPAPRARGVVAVHVPEQVQRVDLPPPSTQNFAQCGWLRGTAPPASARVSPSSNRGP